MPGNAEIRRQAPRLLPIHLQQDLLAHGIDAHLRPAIYMHLRLGQVLARFGA